MVKNRDRKSPKSSPALHELQSDSGARVGLIKREFAEHPSKGLTPSKLYRILEAAEMGDLKAQHDLFDDMEEKDPQIASDLAKRRQLAAELDWQIVPPDGASAQERAAADFCAEVFSGIEVEDLIIDLGSAIGHGWANLELPWTTVGGKRIIEQPIFRPHAWFMLNPDDQDELRLRDHTMHGAALWPLGWVQHRHRAKSGYVARSGLLRVLAWPYLFQNYALGDLAELLEIYGLPTRIGTYPRNATDKEKATLLRAVTSLGHRAAGIIPEGMAIEFKEAAQGRADMFEVMLRWCEQAKAKAILGGTLTGGTGEGTNTNALGNVHERSQTSLIRSDARQYAGTINRDILWPLAALNFGIDDRRRAPRFFLDTGDATDLKYLADTLPVFVDMGAKIPAWWLHEKTRIPQAGSDEETLQPRSFEALKGAPVAALRVAANAGTDAASADYSGPQEDPTPVSLMVERLGDEAEPAWREIMDAVRRMVDEAESLPQLRERLLAAYGDLPGERLAEVMALGFAAAHLAGIYDVERDADASA